MSTQPLPAAKFREFDANGNPLVGGKLYTYAAGTTTPLATYTDSTGNTPNANPVVLDAAGRADVWLTPGLLYKLVLQDSAGNTIYTEDNYPSTSSIANTSGVATDPGGRLTLTNGTPVATGDVTGATTVYYAPYKHSFVPIFDGTNWALQSIGAGLSQPTADNTKSPAAVANNSNYDLFVWNDSGTVRLSRGPAWTSDTARGAGIGTTEITQQNGRWVNKNAITNGPGALLGTYVGTVRSDGSAQINDSEAKRHCWNTYNRVRREMVRNLTPGVTWSYSAATYRQANADPANQLDYVCGLAEDCVDVAVMNTINNNTANATGGVGIGIDSTTVNGAHLQAFGTSNGGTFYSPTHAAWRGIAGLGRHFLAWLEISSAIGAYSWGVQARPGIIGSIPA